VTRLEAVQRILAERALDALLVSQPANVLYLTGYTGTNGVALVHADGAGAHRFVTDFRYVTQASEQVDPAFERDVGATDLLETLPPRLAGYGVRRLGFDDAHLSVKQHARFAELTRDEIELVGAGGVVEGLRAVKDASEIERIRAAAAVVDDVFGWAVDRGLVGLTEKELAADLERELVRRGGDGAAFPAIVAAGENSALPHARPRDVPIPPNTLITIDIGARVDGYCSDATRTFATGEVDGEAREVYDLVRRAQGAGLDALRPGPLGREVDAIARAVVDDAGHAEHFGHGLGHGVGLEVHEGPRLAKLTGTAPLVAGHVVTVEPGVYLPGRFGVRIEDLAVVTADGCEVLSRFPKDLVTVA
jgi:Xaa-Pro aminopeptidase